MFLQKLKNHITCSLVTQEGTCWGQLMLSLSAAQSFVWGDFTHQSPFPGLSEECICEKTCKSLSKRHDKLPKVTSLWVGVFGKVWEICSPDFCSLLFISAWDQRINASLAAASNTPEKLLYHSCNLYICSMAQWYQVYHLCMGALCTEDY